ncbi:uncharacterized protein LOC131949780 [Physella acuta]|uniref:uncharacterized protein LOC131949780 n=1 Tax=Physella acuta TaxID=109671 RepID=UPI0027DC500F|nr:uncharacterized protein LOC131949780 [Physella acuta]
MSYQILSKLGGGAFGQVYRLRVPNGNEYALKLIALTEKTNYNQAKAEAELMMRLSHPYIVQCGQYAFVGDNLVCLVLEYCGRGNLTNAIVSVVPEQQALLWFAQMADAITYLHGEKIMHRDIKPDNILLGGNSNIKVGDLGIARE